MTLRNQQLEEELEDLQANSEVHDDRLKKVANDLRKVSDELTVEKNKAQQLLVKKFCSSSFCFDVFSILGDQRKSRTRKT